MEAALSSDRHFNTGDGAKAEALADGVDPRRIAQRMLRQRWNEGGRGGFWRQLPSNGWDPA